ncbi:hypothetical protein [Candidatus Phycosocius spiralis]|uniref:N-acetyltransferase domain-containing protein n=1 Tax=Candidatus Phycosocius spiralis TaxID=2815099 RepID=A0ABQ4PYA8_9PROT|nr:hypothetical protein [Candidatus Phycosocius spiralis]GIU67895.1 hypothetical protein PsB1_2049 [Candidatus Phycosocius spiralis]
MHGIEQHQLLHAFDLNQRRRPDGHALPSTWVQTPFVTRDHGHVIWQSFYKSAYPTLIAAELEIARASGAFDFEWKLYEHDAPGGLALALQAAGFVQQPTETLLVRSTDLSSMAPVPGLEIVRVEDLALATLCHDLGFQAFGYHRDKSPQALLERALAGEPFWLGLYEGQAVSMGRLIQTAGSMFAGLYGGASHPDYRHRGFYRPVVYARIKAAADLGCQWVFSEALPTSEPILRALGFQALSKVTGYLYRFDN